MLVRRLNNVRFYGLIMSLLLSITLITSLLIIPAHGTADWWDSNWGFRMEITINNSDITEDLINFPMPIVFTSAQAGFWTHVKSGGEDIRFIGADDLAELYFELEQWNYTGNQMTAWVKIPQIAAGSATGFIWVYYGCASAGPDAYCNSNNVWDSDYRAVWHLNQTEGAYNDATSNNNHLMTVSGVGRNGVAKVGSSCPTFNGINNYLSGPSSASLKFPGDLMIEEWVNTNNPAKEQNVISKNDVGQGKGWNHELYDANNVHIQNGEGSPDMEITNTRAIASAGVWYHVVWVWDEDGADKATAYVNGVKQTTTGAMADWTDLDVPVYVGVSNVAGRYPFDGRFDEMRLSDLARSPQWIKACYEYESDPTKLALGSEEEGFLPTTLFVDPALVTKTLDQVGTTFKVNVTIGTVRSLQGFDFNLTWNNDLIALSSIDFGSTLDRVWGSGNWFLAYNQSGLGYCEVAAASTALSFTSQQAVPLAVLTFQVKYASSGETSLHFAIAKLSNSRGHSIPSTITDGAYRFTVQTKIYVDPALVERVPSDVGTTFGLNVTVGWVVDLFGFDLNITWDNSLITLNAVDYKSTLDAVWGLNHYSVPVNMSGDGWYKLVALSLTQSFSTISVQPLVKMTFLVYAYHGHEEETALHFSVAKLSNSYATPIPADAIDGTYRIKVPGPTLRMVPTGWTCRKYGETFTVTVNVSDAVNFEDFRFEVHYNTTLLDYVAVTWNAWGSGTISADEINGVISGLTSGTALNGTRALVTVQFRAAYYHVWKSATGWTNDVIGTIFFQWANLSFPTGPDLRYERGGLNEVNVGPDFVYDFSPVQGDVNNDGTVDITDLRTVAAYFMVKQGDPRWTEASNYDLDGNTIVDILDLRTVAENYDYTYGP